MSISLPSFSLFALFENRKLDSVAIAIADAEVRSVAMTVGSLHEVVN